jgi:NarL family two-component system response regulator LiaR
MTGSDRIRVLVVDDHKVVRNGLRTFMSVQDDIEMVGEAANGEEAVEQCAALMPDVVLMDMKMPVMDGPNATEAIRARFPDVQVVALTSFEDESYAYRAIEAGAIGYLFKDVNEEQLMSTIRLASQGRGVMAPHAIQAIVAGSLRNDDQTVNLTPREFATLELLAKGLTNPQIAERLVVSASTVNFHVHNVLNKLGAKTRTEAVVIAAREGLIDV